MRMFPGPRFSGVSALIWGIGLAGLIPGVSTAQGVRVSAGTIEDRRTTGRFFAGLEIELKLTGDDVADANSARVIPKEAVDETGRDILPEQKPDDDFRSVGSSPLKLALKNPARGAAAVKEIAGEVLLLQTRKSIVSSPFTLANVPLP